MTLIDLDRISSCLFILLFKMSTNAWIPPRTGATSMQTASTPKARTNVAVNPDIKATALAVSVSIIETK